MLALGSAGSAADAMGMDCGAHRGETQTGSGGGGGVGCGEVGERGEKKCPAVDFFGVAQSPKSSLSGTIKSYLLGTEMQEQNLKKMESFSRGLFIP